MFAHLFIQALEARFVVVHAWDINHGTYPVLNNHAILDLASHGSTPFFYYPLNHHFPEPSH